MTRGAVRRCECAETIARSDEVLGCACRETADEATGFICDDCLAGSHAFERLPEDEA